MLKKRKRPKMGIRKAPQIRCPSHLAWIRQHCCAIALRHDCEGSIEAAHVRAGTDGGLGVKPSDIYTIALCREAHREQHQIGEPAFERKYSINMKKLAEMYAKKSPHKAKWEPPAEGDAA